MRNSQKLLLTILVLLVSVLSWGSAWAADGTTTVQAESPFTGYTASVAIYVFIVAALVIVLLGGAFLVLNLGLLSKRREDRVGGRTPSDVGILKEGIWPVEPRDERSLPAEESEEELARPTPSALVKLRRDRDDRVA